MNHNERLSNEGLRAEAERMARVNREIPAWQYAAPRKHAVRREPGLTVGEAACILVCLAIIVVVAVS